MTKKNPSARRLYGALAAALVLWATPALAQFQPRPMLDDDADVPTGERYHIEGQIGLWSPSADMEISSEGLGIIGSVINFKDDLGLTDQSFPEFHVTLRPARRHKFRFQYVPISFSQASLIERNIVFNGQLYPIGVEVESQLPVDQTAHGEVPRREFDIGHHTGVEHRESLGHVLARRHPRHIDAAGLQVSSVPLEERSHRA